MTTPNSLLFLGNLIGAGSTPGILPGNMSAIKTPANFYVTQNGLNMMPAPILRPEWSIDGNSYFPFRREEDGTIIELADADIVGGIILIPRVNPDVLIRFTASGNLGGMPDLNAFIG